MSILIAIIIVTAKIYDVISFYCQLLLYLFIKSYRTLVLHYQSQCTVLLIVIIISLNTYLNEVLHQIVLIYFI